MSKDAVRLALGGSLIPLLPGLAFFALGTITLVRLVGTDSTAVWLSLSFAIVTGVLIWWLIWRGTIPWSRRTVVWTLLLAAVFLASAACAFVLTDTTYWGSQAVSEFVQSTVIAVPFLAASAWFGGSALLWRAKGASSMNLATGMICEVICPQCTYNLRGLREVRCPECGWASTVDDIVGRGIAEHLARSGGAV